MWSERQPYTLNILSNKQQKRAFLLLNGRRWVQEEEAKKTEPIGGGKTKYMSKKKPAFLFERPCYKLDQQDWPIHRKARDFLHPVSYQCWWLHCGFTLKNTGSKRLREREGERAASLLSFDWSVLRNCQCISTSIQCQTQWSQVILIVFLHVNFSIWQRKCHSLWARCCCL